MIPFVGPSYTLAERKAGVQRSINMHLAATEPNNPKSPAYLRNLFGLTEFADLGAPVRGLFTSPSGSMYAAAGNKAKRVQDDGTSADIGTLLTSLGPVEFGVNTSQVCMVDGPGGYVVTLADDAFATIAEAGFYGSNTIAVIDGYGLFVRPDTQQFYLSGLNDFLTYDATEFASAEGLPDNTVAIVADARQARVLGTDSGEVWFNSGAADFPFSRDGSQFMEYGTLAPYAARMAGRRMLFLGKQRNSSGAVYMAAGNEITRVSTDAVEKELANSTDLSAATAFCFQEPGHQFYWLNAPGLETSWVFDISYGEWFEAAELVGGEYIPHRATCHTYAFGLHLFGAENGKVYTLDRTVNTNAGDVLPRRRISPHFASAQLDRTFFGTFRLDASAGNAPSDTIPKVSMRYSNNGGNTWQAWRERELGRIGEYNKIPEWACNGSAKDRVWDVLCTDDAPFNIMGAVCPLGAGNG